MPICIRICLFSKYLSTSVNGQTNGQVENLMPYYYFHIDTNIKFLEAVPQICSVATVIKITIPKNADTSKDELLLGGGICHLTSTSQYHAHRKQVPAYVNNIV